MTTIHSNEGNERFKQIERDSWASAYLPALCAGVLMTGVLFLAISCSKSDKPGAKISAPFGPAVTSPAPVSAAASMPEPPKKARKHRPASATYVNGEYGVSFSYPRKYSLQTGNTKKEAAVQNNFTKPGAVQIATVDMPDDSYPETDFSSALLNVSVLPGANTDECSQFAAGAKDAGTVKPSSVKLGANEFSEFEQINGVGDRKSDLKYFHLLRNGACYEFALDLETSVRADGELVQVDRGKVFQKLEKILATARIKDVELPGLETGKMVVGTETIAPESKAEKAQVVTPEQK